MSSSVETLVLENTRLKEENAELSAKVQWFEEQHRLELLRRFGPSSEKTPPEQQTLVFNEAEATAADPVPFESETEVITYRRRKADGRRDAQLAKLPQETIVYILPEDKLVCPCCAGTLHEMGEEVRREIKIIPAQISVLNHKRIVYACRQCQKDEIKTPVITAPMPTPAFPGGIGSPTAVAYIATEKFVKGLPLYRQQQDLARMGFDLSRQTMANWILKGADWLGPVYDRLHAVLLERDILHADESTVQVLHEEGRAAKTKSTMWLYRTGRDGPPIALFEYQPTRGGEHPKRFLNGFHGYLHVDGYEGYGGLTKPKEQPDGSKLPPDVILVGCWSHARRGFKEALEALPPSVCKSSSTAAAIGLKFCNDLFDIERDLKDATPEERKAGRDQRSRPLLESFHSWLEVQANKTLPKSRTGQSISYCLGQWAKLVTFLEDGRLEIDNNRSERSIKPFVIGRKNWLFANTPGGATASAIIYSIVETAKENELVPFEYLTHLFEQLPGIAETDRDALDDLLPWSPTVKSRCKVPASI
jgi:transposase